MTYAGNVSDEELMIAFAKGDMKAFEALYRRLSPKVYGYLRSKLKNAEDIDEVFQKIFTKLHANRRSYDSKYPVLQWVFVVSKSGLLDHVKSSKRKENLKSELKISDDLSQNGEQPSLSEQMDRSLLKDLTPEAQSVVRLRIIEELDFDEISRLLGKSEASVRQILSRSIKKLRVSFGGTE